MTLGRRPGSKKTKRSGTSSSVHVHHLYTSRSLAGRTTLKQEVLNATAIHKRQAKDREDHALRQEAMTMEERMNWMRSATTLPLTAGVGILTRTTLSTMHGRWRSILFLLAKKPLTSAMLAASLLQLWRLQRIYWALQTGKLTVVFFITL